MASFVGGGSFAAFDHDEDQSAKPIPPIFTLNQKNQTEILEWLEDTVDSITRINQSRYMQAIKNICRYRGMHYSSQDKNNNFLDREKRYEVDTQKVVVNETYDVTQRRTAKLTRFLATTIPVPATNEYNDKVDAQTVKKVLETVAYQNDREQLIRDITTRMQIFGEQDILILWDKDKGSLHPKWKKLKDAYDKSGKRGKKYIQVKEGDETKKILFDPDTPRYIGDITYKLPLPWEILKDPVGSQQEVSFVIYKTTQHVEKVKRDHPDVNPKHIEPEEDLYHYDLDTFAPTKRDEHVTVYEVWAKSSKYLPQGLYFKATPSVLLVKPEANPYPENDSSVYGNLPIETRRDVTIPGKLCGLSSYQIWGNLQDKINQGHTMAHRALMLLGHPKLAVPRSANINRIKLGNDATMFEYDGDQLPQVLNTGVIHPEVFNWIGGLTDKLKGLAGTHPVSSGKPPEGIKAGIAIRMLEEIENESRSSDIKNQNDLLVNLDRKTLSVIGKYYKDNDDRLIKIVGRDKSYTVESFSTSVLNKSYDIRVKLASSLPQTPAARIQTVIDLHQFMPGIFTKEQVIDALDLAEPGKLVDAITASKSTAEWENEEFVRGNEPPEPREGEGYLVHWHTHNTFYQSRGYMELPESSKERFQEHQQATEFLMWLHAQRNPKFAQMLLELENYPQFFKMPEESANPAVLDAQQPGAKPQQPQGAAAPQGAEFPQTEPAPDNVLTPGAPVAATGGV